MTPQSELPEEGDATKEAGLRAEEIFYEALQVPDAAGRMAYVREACGTDEDLHQEVLKLLATHQQAEHLFQETSAALDPAGIVVPDALPSRSYTDEAVGTWMGPYQLVQWIGEGGGGVVYLAEQETPVKRRVAFKIIKLGMDTRSVIARFDAERQSLAMMDHPNIARVLDAGATETGRPYFVMEYVPGMKITDYCVKHRLDLRQRLGLFRQVCHAIQHSHQKGIIHRDIKPSNILVACHDGVPLPKVIDFGIAKATEGRRAEEATLTACGQLIGTPAYMSPEQTGWGLMDVDTRSDIYSLGAVLYELLTGRTPFENDRLLKLGLDEMRRKLREEEPPRPSAVVRAVTAAGKPVEGAIQASWLRSDLDWIVMKALEKNRDRRYQTAGGLAADVERYLAQEPVVARPPSRFYRVQKWVRRNKATFAALTAVTLTLVTSTVVSTHLYFKARTAEQHETELRRRAEDREKITRAAILVSQRKMEEAHALLATTAFPVSQPSIEATGVFRALGEWSAINNRWADAAARMVALVQVNQTDPSDQTDAATRDLLMAAPALIEAGDLAGFVRLRTLALSRFARTTNPIAAEHVMKISALQPIAPDVLQELEPLRKMARNTLANWTPQRGSSLEAWRCTVLGLLEFRSGRHAEAIKWSRLGLAHPDDNLSRAAMSHFTEAMSAHRLGQAPEARAALARGAELVNARFQKPLDLRRGKDGGWFDWVGARILQREATRLINASTN